MSSLPVARQGDLCTGHDCYPPRESIEGSPTVFCNGRPLMRKDDKFGHHGCDRITHDSRVSKVSSKTVFVNGINVARVTDEVQCGSNIMTGSENVYSG